MPGTPQHAVVDWGTSMFRLWLLDAEGNTILERRSAEGMATTESDRFDAVLESHLATINVPKTVPAMICGMAGARAGWIEAPYVNAPARLDDLVLKAVEAPSSGRKVMILPGIAQRRIGRPGVMRGEETQLLGLPDAARHDGLICLPGTHSKWVRITGGAVDSFSTFMTGELFQLIRSGSILKPALAADAIDAEGAAFAGGVADAYRAPVTVAGRLFELRAGWLLDNVPTQNALARLSGLLIGLELAGIVSAEGTLSGTTLVAAGPLAALYLKALSLVGASDIDVVDAEASVRAGLHRAALAAFPKAEAAP